MKICYLGLGSWGYALSVLLSKKGYRVVSWTIDEKLCATLNETRRHPLFPDIVAEENHTFTTSMAEALEGADAIVESVTTAGLRPVLAELQKHTELKVPFILTSKGIEISTGLTLPDVVLDVLGKEATPYIGLISGPSFATEVIHGLPASLVGTAFEPGTMVEVCKIFNSQNFRVYPNTDIEGVALAGALKNIIAITCGMASALGLGCSANAALMTRGLHEIRKLAVALGCRPETISGLAGMGDLCMTCSSPLSRNYLFGQKLIKGTSPQTAMAEIGMVVEGAFTCQAAYKLSQKLGIEMPITEGLYKILQGDMKVEEAIPHLMQRQVKEEHL